MKPAPFKTVPQYITLQPKPVQAVLRKVRATLKKALPGAREVISYQIPALRLNDRNIVYFAGWKKHYSLYPASAHVVAALKAELEPYELSKGTVRFPLDQAVPVRLIARFAKLRAQEIASMTPKKSPRTKR